MVGTESFQEVAALVSRALGAATPDTLDVAVSTCLEAFGTFADVDVAFATLIDDQEQVSDDWHWIRPGRNAFAPRKGSPLRETFGSAIEFLRLGNTVALADLEEVELAPSERRLAAANGLRAIVVVPVRIGPSLLGVAGLMVMDEPRAWRRSEVGQAELLGQLLVQAVIRTRERGALAAADARARRIAEFIPDGLVLLDLDGTLTWASPSFVRSSGFEPTDLETARFSELVYPDDRDPVAKAIDDASRFESGTATARVRGRDGWRWTDLSCRLASEPESGAADEIVVSLRDAHDRHLQTELLARASARDALTGVANRSALDRMLDDLSRQDAQLMIAFCDVDCFKVINDRHGHDAGDGVLRAVARALTSAVRPSDLVARLGGDEFVVVVVDQDGVDHQSIGERLVASARALSIGGATPVTMSVGLSAIGPATSAPELLRSADAAMYEAKRAGRDRWSRARQAP